MTARILAVDGAARNLRLIEARLARAYHHVTTAESAEAALALAGEERPDVIMVGALGGDADGYGFCRQLKSDPMLADIPVILINRNDDRGARARVVESRADDFLTEPFDDLSLMARVRSLSRLKTMVDELRLRERVAVTLGAGGATRIGAAAFAGARLLLIEEPGRRTAEKAAALSTLATVRVEASGEAGARAAVGGDFDAILLSLSLPDADSADIVRRLRRGEVTRNTPIVVMAPSGESAAIEAALGQGVEDFLLRPVDPQEMQARLRTQVYRRRLSEHLRHGLASELALAVTDPLTGLFNRQYLNAHLSLALGQGAVPRFVALVIKLDRMGDINRRFGLGVGDYALRDCALRLQRNLRGFDLAVRYGGVHFVTLLSEIDAITAVKVAERLARAIGGGEVSGDGPRLGCAIGVAAAEAGDSPRRLLDRAFAGLARARAGAAPKVGLAA